MDIGVFNVFQISLNYKSFNTHLLCLDQEEGNIPTTGGTMSKLLFPSCFDLQMKNMG